MGYLFRIILLIWSCGQGDSLDFSLLIIPVISLYVGCFTSNTFKSLFNFQLILLRAKAFLKNE